MIKHLKFTNGKALYNYEPIGTYKHLQDGKWIVTDHRGTQTYPNMGQVMGHFICFDWSSRIPSQNHDGRLGLIVKDSNTRKRFALT